MPNVYLAIDLIVVLALIGLGLTVLLQNSRAELNRIFAFFVGSVGIWIISNYISNDTHNPPQPALIANYFVFCFSYLAAYFLLRFSVTLANDRTVARILKVLKYPLFLIALSSFGPLVVTGVKVQGSVYALQFGPLESLYFISLSLIVVAVLYVLGINIRRAKDYRKARLKLMFFSLCTALPLLMLMQAVLPSVFGWFGLTNIGITPMLVLVFGLYYSVVKHRLFDLRLLIVRSLAYVVSLGVISLFYGVVSFYITNRISADHSSLAGALNIALIIIAIVVYPSLKTAFNKLTNKLFFRDAYDTQTLFDDLNKTLVRSLETEDVLDGSAEVIVKNLKADYCAFVLKKTAYESERIIGTNKNFNQANIQELLDLTSGLKGNVISADYLDDKQEKVKMAFRDNNVAVLVYLTPSSHKNNELGHILLGNKKSGNPYTAQDIRILGTMTKELVIAIQNALRFEEIQHFNITLQAKVNEATRRLRHANERLKTLDETKDDFISMASHQLRTPLTSVKGYLSMVLEGDAGKITSTEGQMLNQAYASAQRMVYLIADLLNVSRLKTGKFIIEPAPADLSVMAEEEIEQLTEVAKSKNLQIVYDKPKQFPLLMLDETKTRQVIMNFIDNATYYTPSGGKIEVKLLDKPETIELRVEDNGIGVPKSEQHHLFSKFYRAGNARKARPDGTGLGLFMAKKVVIAQGGSIIFESQEGKGSTFGFIFSKKRLTAPAKDPAPKEESAKEVAKA